MSSFIDKLMKDKILGQYFNNNKMKHCIPNKIVLFFAYNKGIMNPDDMKSLRDIHKMLKLNVFDFDRSIILFKEALYENNIDPLLVEETLTFYKTMKKELIYDSEKEEEEKILLPKDDAKIVHMKFPTENIHKDLENNFLDRPYN